MPSDIAAAWDRHSAAYQEVARLSTRVAHYGPDIPTEAELRLLGDLRGKKVLELGCGGAQCSIVFAKQGATGHRRGLFARPTGLRPPAVRAGGRSRRAPAG